MEFRASVELKVALPIVKCFNLNTLQEFAAIKDISIV